jgi:hypothetical protein
MIHVIAVITAKPGKREEILRAFRANVPAVRAEKGCIEYGAAIDAENALPIQAKWVRTRSSRSRSGKAWTHFEHTRPRRTWRRTRRRRAS